MSATIVWLRGLGYALNVDIARDTPTASIYRNRYIIDIIKAKGALLSFLVWLIASTSSRRGDVVVQVDNPEKQVSMNVWKSISQVRVRPRCSASQKC